MKKTIIPVLCTLLAFTSLASASDLSGWAKPEYEAANSAGLLPESIVSHRLTDKITRAEFCEAVMNLYSIMGGQNVNSSYDPFYDTDSQDVLDAYFLGIINGKTSTLFYPQDPINRQEMAKMIMRTINAADKNAHITQEEFEKLVKFDDLYDADSWAVSDIAKSVKYDIINGVSKTLLLPKGYATREQAVAILNRAFQVFCENKTYYNKPQFTDISNGSVLIDKLSFGWTGVLGAKGYTVIIKDSSYSLAHKATTATESIDLTSVNLPKNKTYTLLVGAKMTDEITVFSDPVDIYYGKSISSGDVLTSLSDKYNRVFPGGVPFKTQKEADSNMRNITVPVWKMGTNGEKYSGVAYLTVNKNLADEIVQIFTEIYSSPEKFPIKDVGAYSWRQTAFGSVSQHSYGTCVDINFDENYYCYPSGQAIVGSFWKPYENPYSIPADGSVVKTFSKYGWTWGGNWTNLKDYMHFSYLGK